MTQSYILLIRLHFNINISRHSSCISVRYQHWAISPYTICWHPNTTKACVTIVDLKYGRLNNIIQERTTKALFQKDVKLKLCVPTL